MTSLRRRAGVTLVALLCATAGPPPPAGAATYSELVKSGFELLQRQGYEEAADTFAAALELEPESEPVRKGLARAWAEIGKAHVRAGRLRKAREAFEKSVAANPAGGEHHLLLAQVLYRLGELRDARAETDRALEVSPGDPLARELSGDLYNREGRLGLAAAEWEAAAKAGGPHALAEKLARVRRDMAAEEGMERQTSRYFTIQYDRDVPSALVEGFFKLLDEVFNTLHDRLGEYPREEIPVILYSQVTYRDVTRAPDWSGGLFDGRVIRVPVGGLRSVEEAAGLLNILAHEMTHAFLYRMAPEGLPLWFNEGLATASQGWDPAKIRSWFAEHPPEGLATLNDVDRTLRGRGGDVTAGYAAARLAVAVMEEIRGFGAIRRVIGGVGAGEPFEDVFREEMRMDLAEFQDRWQRGFR
jgi:tetratricopeptide (TPR) repeat protein